MRMMFASLASLLACGCATAALQRAAPVEVLNGKWIRLWGIAVTPSDSGMTVDGMAARNPGRQGQVREHVHVEAIGAGDQVLKLVDAPFNSALSLRQRNSATFNASFDEETSASLTRVRISVADGPFHR